MSLARPFLVDVEPGTAILGEPPAPIGNRMDVTSAARGSDERLWRPGMDQNTANMRGGGSKPYPPIVKPRAPFVVR